MGWKSDRRKKRVSMFFRCILDIILREKGLSIQDARDNQLHIFANGPSLKKTMELAKKDDVDVMIVNCSVQDDLMKRFNVRWVAMADPNIIDNEILRRAAERFCVETQAKLILPNYLYEKWDNRLFLKENGIKVLFRQILYRSVEKYDFKYLEKNTISTSFMNVINLALYAGIQLGYKKIYIHGLDFDYIKNMNMFKGQLYLYEKHFYDKENVEPILGMKLYDEINCLRYALLAFRILSKYADYENVKVVNMCDTSFVEFFSYTE